MPDNFFDQFDPNADLTKPQGGMDLPRARVELEAAKPVPAATPAPAGDNFFDRYDKGAPAVHDWSDGSSVSAYRPGLWGRIKEVAADTVDRSPAGELARWVGGFLPSTRDYDGAAGADNGLEAQQARAQARITQAERDRREQYAGRTADDPWNRDSGVTLGNVGRFGANAAAMLGAGALSDPTNFIAPGRTLLQKMLAQGAIGGAVDAGVQGIDMAQGVQDHYDPLQTAVSAAGGAALVGTLEGVPALRAWWKSRGIDVDRVPDEALVDGAFEPTPAGPAALGAPPERLLLTDQRPEAAPILLPDGNVMRLPAPPAALPDLRGEIGLPSNSNRTVPLGRENGAVTPEVIAGEPDRVAAAQLAEAAERLRAMLQPESAPSVRADLMASTRTPAGAELWQRIARGDTAPAANDLPALPHVPAAPTYAPLPVGRTAGIGSRASMVDITRNTESGGRRYGADGKLLTSPKGAQGEMQVMPGTSRDPGFGVRPAADNSPDELARVGRDYLAKMQERYAGDPEKAWAAYNAGPGAVDRRVARYGDGWLSKMPAETRAYVGKNMAALGGERPVIDAPRETTTVMPVEAGDRVSQQAPTAEPVATMPLLDDAGGAPRTQPLQRRVEEPTIAAPPEPSAPRAPTDAAPPAPARDALADLRDQQTRDVAAVQTAQFRPDEIEADAKLMQFKAGGDQHGVTDRLAGVERWEPAFAKPLMVWEGKDGRRLVADGHQRLGLAKRLTANGENITLDAKVMREADGVTAREARATAALNNMSEGSGTSIDAAKVIRDMGERQFDSWSDRLPQRGDIVREGKALAKLSDDAFGAVVNDVIDPKYGAAIARALPDQPDRHMAMIEALHEADPSNVRQADDIIRQVIDAGFNHGEQTDMFGTQQVSTALFKTKAQIVDDTRKLLGRLKNVYGTAAKEADTLANVAGNRIERDASAKEASANAQAADIIGRLAYRRGNAVSDALDAAARKVAGGGSRAGAAREFADAVRATDLEALARGSDEGGAPVARDNRDGPAGLAPAREADEDLGSGLFEQRPQTNGETYAEQLRSFRSGKALDASVIDRLTRSGFLEQKPGADRPHITDAGRDHLRRHAANGGEAGFITPDMLLAPFRAVGRFLFDAEFRGGDGQKAIAAIARAMRDPKAVLGKAGDRLVAFGEATAYSTDSALRSMGDRFNAPTLSKLADLFHAEAGVTSRVTTRTFGEAVSGNTVRFTSALDKALTAHVENPAALNRIRDLLASPNRSIRATAEERATAGTLRDLLAEVLEYRRDAGEAIGEVNDGYFPRQMRQDKVFADPEGFLRAAESAYREIGAPDPAKAAAAYLQRNMDGHLGIADGVGAGSPGSNSTKAREFGKAADQHLREFYDTNPLTALTSYVSGSVKRAEETRRFGIKGRENSPERAAWMKEHGDRTQWDVMRGAIQAEFRVNGVRAPNVLERIEALRSNSLGKARMGSPKLGSAVSVIHAWNQLSTLGRSVIASIPELSMGFVRGGPRYGFDHMTTTFKEFARNVRRLPPSDAARYAEAAGAIGADNSLHLLRARADDVTANSTSSKILDQFYRKNGLEAWTRAGRTAAVKTAQRFVDVLAHDIASTDARTSNRAAGYLRELGVRDPKTFAAAIREDAPTLGELRGDEGHAAEYATALLRFANQSVLMPTRSVKPSWASHPIGSLVFALQSYNYAFKKNVLDRVGRQTMAAVKEKDPVKLSAAAGLLVLTGTTALVQGLRHTIYGSPVGADEQTSIDYALETMDRTGLFGAASPLMNAFKGLRYQRSVGQALQGSVLGRTSDGLDAIGGLVANNNENTDAAERKAAAAFYDLAVKPAEAAIGASVLRGALGSAVILGTGVRNDDGLLPADRAAFVDTVGGPDPKAEGEDE